MNRIGIMTWYFGANYGALAQSISLYKTVCSLGYECVMINYKPEGYIKTILVANTPPKWKRLIHLGKTIKGIKKCISLSGYKYFIESTKVYSAKEIDELGLECIIFGSDAIFNIKHPLCNSLYYGVNIQTKKISFSPSCEYLSVDTELSSDCKQSLLEMSSLSVRDTNTYKLIYNNTKLEPVITLDPTFLYDFNDIRSEINIGEYILIYSFSDWSNYKNKLINYARDNGLVIISIGKYLEWADYSFADASFEMWVTSFRYAKLVMTDSFHGTVFSLKNRKQIVLCGRSDKESKISSLLKQLEVNINIYHGEDVEEYLNKNFIEYDYIQQVIESEKQKSIEFLKNALL